MKTQPNHGSASPSRPANNAYMRSLGHPHGVPATKGFGRIRNAPKSRCQSCEGTGFMQGLNGYVPCARCQP